MDRIADIFAGITVVALVATVVGNRNTSKVITAIGDTYSKSIRAAMGK